MYEAILYVNMPDEYLSKRQQWLKYECIERQKRLEHLIATRNEINKKITDLEKEII